ncbi:MAG TPA: GNAT family N-acetyltransferase [Peptococcaceae bacterium]|nr:GNAT family N-acetyltransferase [Peptococcaceae bacterium]
MIEIRLAQKGEIAPQKEIWKLCFADSAEYINLFYDYRYEEGETLLLLQDGNIVSMLTMRPVTLVNSSGAGVSSVMLYALATHPKFRHKGLMTQLMDFCHQALAEQGIFYAILVPEGLKLANFYRKFGYRHAFFVREAKLSASSLVKLPGGHSVHGWISAASPQEYNRRRNELLEGITYISYPEEEIAYQKKLSQLLKADIYAIDILMGKKEIQGCATVERLSERRVLIREILLTEEHIGWAIKQLAQHFPAEEYIIRTPVEAGKYLGGTVKPLGMLKVITDAKRQNNAVLSSESSGYLGLAFD